MAASGDLIDDDDVNEFLDLMRGEHIEKPCAYLRALVRKHVEPDDLNRILRKIDTPPEVANPPAKQEATA